MPPVIRAATVHFMLGYDHYFADGNGRTARALFYWGMLHQGYWLAEFITISGILKQAPSQYVKSYLLTEDDDGDVTYFLLYHLEVIQRALDELNDYLGRKADELSTVRSFLHATRGEFNHRQISSLESMAKDASSYATARSYSRTFGTSDETARSDLGALEKRRLLMRSKHEKEFVCRATSDLIRQLDASAELRG